MGAPNKIIAGIDEVGRGALAGEVVAAAVILPHTMDINGIDDSKKLSAKKREILNAQIRVAAKVGVGAASAKEIDELGIVPANFLAMVRAVNALPQKPHGLLVDGTKVPPALCADFQAHALIKGDSLSLSIAAASIIAKTARDSAMRKLALTFPDYGWHSNVGYGAAVHLAAIKSKGATPHHRMSFAPLKNG